MNDNLSNLSCTEQEEKLARFIVFGELDEKPKKKYIRDKVKQDEELRMIQGHRKTIIGDCPDWIY